MRNRLAGVLCALLVAGSGFAQESIFLTATVVPPPSADQLSNAMSTPKDSYGLPNGIYALDPTLASFRDLVQQKQAGSNILFWGGLGCLPLGYLLAQAVPELVWAPYGTTTDIPYGYFVMAAGGVLVIWDLIGVAPAVQKLKEQLLKAFAESYSTSGEATK